MFCTCPGRVRAAHVLGYVGHVLLFFPSKRRVHCECVRPAPLLLAVEQTKDTKCPVFDEDARYTE